MIAAGLALFAVPGTQGAQGQSVSGWLEVPYYRQQENGCGSAALAMLMGYWSLHEPQAVDRDAAAPGAIHARLYRPELRGIPAKAMQSYLEEHGFQAFAFAGEWRDLAKHIARGRPLIAALGQAGRGRRAKNPGSYHYVVVVGVSGDRVVVHDPAAGKLRTLERNALEARWKQTGSWTLLAVPQPAR